jgi:Ner family transcriptional regulator
MSISNRSTDMAKKTTAPKDWTKEFIKYRISEMFGTMTDMAHCYGLHPSVIRRALRVPYPKVDRVIARALGEHPATIWPSRYAHATLENNPRLWRRWINVESTTENGKDSVSCEGTN